ncbi:MAG: CvpA family protein [Dehalococcoidales bacterium]|nr:CvpA family protein [Dehalococcoidales bacterium]
MNWLDIVILVIVGGAVFWGLKLGLIKAVLSLVGLISSIILAGRYYLPLSEQLTFISQPKVAQAVAFIIILVGIMVITNVLAELLGRITSALKLGWVNRLGGAFLGLMLGAFFCGALLAMTGKFLSLEGIISHSGLAALLLDRFPAILALLPGEFDAVRSFFQ